MAGLVLAAGCGTSRPPPAEPVTPEAVPRERVLYAQAESQLHSPDANVRQQAALMLLSLDYAPALEAVLENMRRAQDPAVRVGMIRAAAFCVDHRCFEAIVVAIRDPDPEVHNEAATALARFTRPDEVAALTELVSREGTTSQERQLLMSALGEGLAVSAVPAMLKGLQSDDEATRIAAWEALRKISGRQLAPEVDEWGKWWEANSHRTREDLLEERLRAFSQELNGRSHQLDDVREQHEELMRLVRSARSETPKLLLKALASRHSVVREYSAFRVAALDGERLNGLKIDEKEYATLRDVLEDPSVQVRQNVIAFVAQLEGEFRDELIKKALRDETPAVLMTAVGAVASSTGEDAVRRLEELLGSSGHAEVRVAAANMLGKVGSGRSIPALAAALNDAVENVRWFAVEGLRKLGATQAVPRISELLQKDPSARVRENAAITLGDLGQPAGIPALREALDDESERVRERAASALLALATDGYERMALIATSFQEHGLLDSARQVLTRIIEQFSDAENMKSRLVATHEQLAGVLKEQTDFAGAARIYETLDELTEGSPEVRRELVECWLRAGEVQRIVSATEQWLAAARATDREALVELALASAELLVESGNGEGAAALLDLVEKAAGEEADPELTSRIEELRGRIG